MSGGSSDILKLDLYEILGVKEDATEKEVCTHRFVNIALIILWN
jgi:DnaJ-class molecular chaperone